MKCKVLDIDYTVDIPDNSLNSTLRQDETEVTVCRPLFVREGLGLICLYRVGQSNGHRLRTLLVNSPIPDEDLQNMWEEAYDADSESLPYFADISKEYTWRSLMGIPGDTCLN